MSPSPKDAELLAGARTWVEVESKTEDLEGLERLADMIGAEAAALGAEVEVIEGRDGFGPHVITRYPAAKPSGNGGVLILSHYDTVHPRGTLAEFPFRMEGDTAWGPGIYDMKAGAYLAMRAAADAHAQGTLPQPVTQLFVSDEEVGSPTSRALIERLAEEARYVLVTEPAREGGQIVVARKGVFRYEAKAFGRPAHSGARHQDGRSAIAELCRLVIAFEALTDYASGTTCNVGLIGGGTGANVVPAQAWCEIDIRVENMAEAARIEAFVAAYTPLNPDVRLEITGGLNRPPYERTAEIDALFDTAKGIAAEIGFELRGLKTGGGSDGNFTAPIRPTLDGLGVDGSGGHTLDEQIRISSLSERYALMKGMLERLP
ncbi:M20 family metallopeptidase [Cereibacter sphaeroides]|nr:M20 family metallopeptidase [Cereibacter sphaeroides]